MKKKLFALSLIIFTAYPASAAEIPGGSFIIAEGAQSVETTQAGEITDQATVKLVQTQLNSLGYDCGEPDGFMGANTRAAIENCQKEMGLTVDGLITADFLTALDNKVNGVEEAAEEVVENIPQSEAVFYKEMYEKYKTVIDALEGEDYNNAVELIDQMRPEVKAGQVKLTLDNWQDYFEVKYETTYTRDAVGAIDKTIDTLVFELKSEYQEKAEVNGEIGYTYKYSGYHVTSVDKETGTYNLEPVSSINWGEIENDYYNGFSESADLPSNTWMTIANIVCVAERPDRTHQDFGILILEAESYDQNILLPDDFQVVRIEGTIKITE